MCLWNVLRVKSVQTSHIQSYIYYQIYTHAFRINRFVVTVFSTFAYVRVYTKITPMPKYVQTCVFKLAKTPMPNLTKFLQID